MEAAELVLKYVEALVWPVTVGILAWCLRAQLHAAFERMTRIETPAATLEFEVGARALREETERWRAEEAADGATEGMPGAPWHREPLYQQGPPSPSPSPIPAPSQPSPQPQPQPQQPSPRPGPEPTADEGAEELEDLEELEEAAPPDPWAGSALSGRQPSGQQPSGHPGSGSWGGSPGQSAGRGVAVGSPWEAKLAEAARFADADPETAVASAWHTLERLGWDVALALALPAADPPTPAGLVRALRTAVPFHTVSALDELRRLRNEVVRPESVSAAGARDFVDSCAHVARRLAPLLQESRRPRPDIPPGR